MAKNNKNKKKKSFADKQLELLNGKVRLVGVEWLIVAVILFADILTKFLISTNLQADTKVIYIIPKFFSFYYTINYAAAFSNDFGLGKFLNPAQVRLVFVFFVTIVCAVFVIILYFMRKKRFLLRLSLGMIISGALGNLYDRIFVHGVRDFIRIEYFGKELFGSNYFPIFNIADSSLVIGVCLFAFYVLFMYGSDKGTSNNSKNKKQEESVADIKSDLQDI